jgi:hypothetical protein
MLGTCTSTMSTGNRNYQVCFPAAGSSSGKITQQWDSGFFGSTNNFYTLGRTFAWQSSTASNPGGYYAFSNGDSCGGAPRSGNLTVQCKPTSGFYKFEPRTCQYNIYYFGPAGCVGSTGSFKNSGLNGVNGFCMSVGAEVGDPVVAAPCSGLSESQQLILQADKTILNPASGLCLDVKGGSFYANVPLQLNTCSGATSQQFKQPSSYPGQEVSMLGNYCITSVTSAINAGTAFSLQPCGAFALWISRHACACADQRPIHFASQKVCHLPSTISGHSRRAPELG